jgi:hypothetical protein
MNAYIKKPPEKSQINSLMIHLEKWEQAKP